MFWYRGGGIRFIRGVLRFPVPLPLKSKFFVLNCLLLLLVLVEKTRDVLRISLLLPRGCGQYVQVSNAKYMNQYDVGDPAVEPYTTTEDVGVETADRHWITLG